MFRELLQCCVTTIATAGAYSLSFDRTQTDVRVFLNFWSGNIHYQVCMGTGPRGLYLPKKIFMLISSFLSLLENPPSCVCIYDCDERLAATLATSLPGGRRPTVAHAFGPLELEKSLALPTSRILERHDFRTILDFLLMKLRTAMDREWLKSLPELYKVIIFPFIGFPNLYCFF